MGCKIASIQVFPFVMWQTLEMIHGWAANSRSFFYIASSFTAIGLILPFGVGAA